MDPSREGVCYGRGMLKVGDRAPDFTAEATDGRTITLSELRGRPVVLYFFPKAFTRGCTIETKRFRDSQSKLTELGAEIIGVSSDNHKTQCDFAASVEAKFPMIGDSSGKVTKAYGVLWPIVAVPRRMTFVIDRAGVIAGVIHRELLIDKILDDTLAILRSLPTA
jgi:peroxiredoxin Q/BCP